MPRKRVSTFVQSPGRHKAAMGKGARTSPVEVVVHDRPAENDLTAARLASREFLAKGRTAYKKAAEEIAKAAEGNASPKYANRMSSRIASPIAVQAKRRRVAEMLSEIRSNSKELSDGADALLDRLKVMRVKSI